MIAKRFDSFTYQAGRRHEGICVYGWSTYPEYSVLAGQPMKVFLDAFGTVEQAMAAYPQAEPSSPLIEPRVSLDRLPGGSDPVSGGMYPDDI